MENDFNYYLDKAIENGTIFETCVNFSHIREQDVKIGDFVGTYLLGYPEYTPFKVTSFDEDGVNGESILLGGKEVHLSWYRFTLFCDERHNADSIHKIDYQIYYYEEELLRAKNGIKFRYNRGLYHDINE